VYERERIATTNKKTQGGRKTIGKKTFTGSGKKIQAGAVEFVEKQKAAVFSRRKGTKGLVPQK